MFLSSSTFPSRPAVLKEVDNIGLASLGYYNQMLQVEVLHSVKGRLPGCAAGGDNFCSPQLPGKGRNGDGKANEESELYHAQSSPVKGNSAAECRLKSLYCNLGWSHEVLDQGVHFLQSLLSTTLT